MEAPAFDRRTKVLNFRQRRGADGADHSCTRGESRRVAPCEEDRARARFAAVEDSRMALLSEIVNSLGGMAQKQQLVRRGAGDRDLTYAVRTGDVVRVRNGWYSTMDERSPQLRAVRVGGRLTGISAIAARGGWVLGVHPLHVAINQNAARLRTQHNRHEKLKVQATGGVVLHWESRLQMQRGSAVSVGLVDALERVVLDEEFENAVAALDWALHSGQLDIIDFESLILRLPIERRGIRDWVDPSCESLPESLARTRFRLSGHSVESQRPMADGRRIDLVVDDVAAIEVDGEEYHRDRFEADRTKEIEITLMGLHALRPSARTVFRDWAYFERAVEVAIAARVVHPRVAENSGLLSSRPFRVAGMTGWRRRPRRRTPEFSARALGRRE
jgi:very-short-patch-repair endonuclease